MKKFISHCCKSEVEFVQNDSVCSTCFEPCWALVEEEEHDTANV